MKTKLTLLSVVLCAANASAIDYTSVSGGYDSNGNYRDSHYRTKPDGDTSNNWSTQGNYNPYTGQEGTKKEPSLGESLWKGLGASDEKLGD